MKAPVDKYFATIFLGAAELIGALTCVLLVHVTGKRPLVFTSLIGCGFCFCGAATYANYLNLVPGAAVNNVVANVSSLDKSMFIDERNLTDATIVYSNDHATNSSASAGELINSTFAPTDDITGTTTDAYDSTYYYDDVNDTLSDQFDEFGDIVRLMHITPPMKCHTQVERTYQRPMGRFCHFRRIHITGYRSLCSLEVHISHTLAFD